MSDFPESLFACSVFGEVFQAVADSTFITVYFFL